MWSFGPLVLFLLLSLGVPALRAHDPYESWALAAVRTEQLELSVTMAQATALRLIDPEQKAGPLTFENFLARLKQLETAAPTLFVISSAGTRLVPRGVEVELTEENDLVFKLTFPRLSPGPLRFQAAFLRQLGRGYGGILEINDAAGENLGWERLSFENSDFEIKVPVPAPPPSAKNKS